MINLLILDTLSIRDFGTAGLLQSISRLSSRVTTTSTAYLQNPFPGAFTNAPLEAGKIYLTTLSAGELHYAYQLSSTMPGLTLADYSVLFLSNREQGMLVTVDSCLVRAAEMMQVNVCSYSQVLGLLADAEIISRGLSLTHYAPLLGRINALALPGEKQLFMYEEPVNKERLA